MKIVEIYVKLQFQYNLKKKKKRKPLITITVNTLIEINRFQVLYSFNVINRLLYDEIIASS